MRSPIYWHPLLYRSIMKLLYGSHFEDRYRAISELIPEGCQVTELCMGDAYLFLNYLKHKKVNYLGLDINPVFVKYALTKGVNARLHNIISDTIPPSDFIIIQASLYQFIPDHQNLVRKILQSANNTLIIAEPVKNLASSRNPVISFLAKYAANPGNANAVHRFSKENIVLFFNGFPEFEKTVEVKGGREIIGIFRKAVIGNFRTSDST